MELKFQENFFGELRKVALKLKDDLKNSMTMFLIMILTIIKSASGEQ